jgi:Carboxypeptidase regulatory-like domain/TonB-dependent Receptor Plug Domain
MRLSRRVCEFFAAFAVIAAGSAGGQSERTSPPTLGFIRGVVTDSGLRPIEGVDVSILLSSIHVATDASGHFQISKVPTGDYLLTARRLGFRPIATGVNVSPGDTARPAILLEPSPTELPAVTIVEHKASTRLREFDERRARGDGEFFTQAQIEARNVVSMFDILRQAKGVRLIPAGPGWFAMSARQWTTCPMQVYVDGVPLAGSRPNVPFDLNLLPSPKEIMGVEVYSGPASVPQWLPNGPVSSGHNCGVILVWTRDGSSG